MTLKEGPLPDFILKTFLYTPEWLKLHFVEEFIIDMYIHTHCHIYP